MVLVQNTGIIVDRESLKAQITVFSSPIAQQASVRSMPHFFSTHNIFRQYKSKINLIWDF